MFGGHSQLFGIEGSGTPVFKIIVRALGLL